MSPMPSHHPSPTKIPSSPRSSMFQTSPKPIVARNKALSSDHLKLSTDMRFHQSPMLKSLDGGGATSSKDGGLEMAAAAAIGPKTPARQHKHSCSEAQKQLDTLRREFLLSTSRLMMAASNNSTNPPSATVAYTYPVSPRLLPLRSPGPVTPLMLEADGDYLVPDARIPEHDLLGEKGQKQLMERLLREESQLRESRGGGV